MEDNLLVQMAQELQLLRDKNKELEGKLTEITKESNLSVVKVDMNSVDSIEDIATAFNETPNYYNSLYNSKPINLLVVVTNKLISDLEVASTNFQDNHVDIEGKSIFTLLEDEDRVFYNHFRTTQDINLVDYSKKNFGEALLELHNIHYKLKRQIQFYLKTIPFILMKYKAWGSAFWRVENKTNFFKATVVPQEESTKELLESAFEEIEKLREEIRQIKKDEIKQNIVETDDELTLDAENTK